MGYLLTVPAMLGALVGGFLYGANPMLPWLFSFVSMGIALALSALHLRDPDTAEI